MGGRRVSALRASYMRAGVRVSSHGRDRLRGETGLHTTTHRSFLEAIAPAVYPQLDPPKFNYIIELNASILSYLKYNLISPTC